MLQNVIIITKGIIPTLNTYHAGPANYVESLKSPAQLSTTLLPQYDPLYIYKQVNRSYVNNIRAIWPNPTLVGSIHLPMKLI